MADKTAPVETPATVAFDPTNDKLTRKRGVETASVNASIPPELDAKLKDITFALRHTRPQSTVIAALYEYVDKHWTQELSDFANAKFGA